MRRFSAALCVVATLAVHSGPALACAYDGLLGDGLKAAHPRSIAVAIAIRDAIDSGSLPPEAGQGIVQGNAGYWSAVRLLGAFRASLSEASITVPSPISILLVESNLWSRLTPEAEGYVLTLHTAGAEPGDAVILTSEAVLAALKDKRFSLSEAFSRGLVAVAGEPSSEESVTRMVASAFHEEQQDEALPTWLFRGVGQ